FTADVPGTYHVTLTVTDNGKPGLTDSVSHDIIVAGVPPTVTSITPNPASPLVGQSVSFTANAADANRGSSLTYAWSFGDGNASTDPVPTNTYSAPGTYEVQLTVTD